MNFPVGMTGENEPAKDSRIEARLRVRFGPGSHLLTGYSINVSHGGLFLETEIPLPVDSPLNLEFELPDSKTNIQCRGRVAWINSPERPLKSHFPPGMGIQFLDLTLADLEMLRKFVKTRMLSAMW
jgi:uncharacterized protein (TIGR02266 family)